MVYIFRDTGKLAQCSLTFSKLLLLPLPHTHTSRHTPHILHQTPSDVSARKHDASVKGLISCKMAPNAARPASLPAKVPLLRHSLMRFALRTWKALVISWFMKLSLLRTLATIIRRSKTSSSSAMVATCIRSWRPSSRLPVYKYWSTAWNRRTHRVDDVKKSGSSYACLHVGFGWLKF